MAVHPPTLDGSVAGDVLEVENPLEMRVRFVGELYEAALRAVKDHVLTGLAATESEWEAERRPIRPCPFPGDVMLWLGKPKGVEVRKLKEGG